MKLQRISEIRIFQLSCAPSKWQLSKIEKVAQWKVIFRLFLFNFECK
jgi:hypothetical protein